MINEKRKTELDELINTLNLSIDNYYLLEVALTHGSYPFETKNDDIEDNERMEFLGDAVLKLIVSRYLYDRFPDYNEGELTKIRSILVSDNTLANIAAKINLDKYLKIGFHEEKAGGRKRSSTLACAFEALLGAFYLDGKFGSLYYFLTDFIKDEVTEIDNSASKYNYKAMLQEYAQSNGIDIPEYIVIKEEGPAHNKVFIVEVLLENRCLGTGIGKSKKEAHQAAARDAVFELGLLEGHEK